MTEELPLILDEGRNSYIYGPDGVPIEQISSGGTVSYLHHDQAGHNTPNDRHKGDRHRQMHLRLVRNRNRAKGRATTPLGYDGQYTSSDTGLIDMRARVYDPTTAQFLSVDPLEAITRATLQLRGRQSSE